MNREEFVKASCQFGYCTKKEARGYMEKVKKDEYTEEDFVEVFRYAERVRALNPTPTETYKLWKAEKEREEQLWK